MQQNIEQVTYRKFPVTVFKIGYYCDEPCKHCGEKAHYEMQEPAGVFWSWCGYCEEKA